MVAVGLKEEQEIMVLQSVCVCVKCSPNKCFISEIHPYTLRVCCTTLLYGMSNRTRCRGNSSLRAVTTRSRHRVRQCEMCCCWSVVTVCTLRSFIWTER